MNFNRSGTFHLQWQLEQHKHQLELFQLQLNNQQPSQHQQLEQQQQHLQQMQQQLLMQQQPKAAHPGKDRPQFQTLREPHNKIQKQQRKIKGLQDRTRWQPWIISRHM
ncbi:hypothetical protein KR084_002795 [Drosophila pseudotakahashii]|nr:hypothetical protein KR084_002795 [Drosophila pseudotakahashii]